MPSGHVIPVGEVMEGTSGWVLGRLVTADGTYLVQGDITGTASQEITVEVYDLDSHDPTVKTLDTTADKTAVIFNTLQTDDYWDEDDIGYNFRYEVVTAACPKGAHRYRAVFYCDTSAFNVVKWAGELRVFDPSRQA